MLVPYRENDRSGPVIHVLQFQRQAERDAVRVSRLPGGRGIRTQTILRRTLAHPNREVITPAEPAQKEISLLNKRFWLGI